MRQLEGAEVIGPGSDPHIREILRIGALVSLCCKNDRIHAHVKGNAVIGQGVARIKGKRRRKNQKSNMDSIRIIYRH